MQLSSTRIALPHWRAALVGTAPSTIEGTRARPVSRLAAAPPAAPMVPGTAPYTPGQFYIREQAPWPTDVPIQAHDLAAGSPVDLVIAGAGPSGLAVGERVARAGYSVVIIDPEPLGIWPNNYGVWVDEFEAMGLADCLEVVWPKAKVWLDSEEIGEK